MKIFNLIKNELKTFTILEKIFFPIFVLSVLLISLYKNDTPIATISALCGLTYTVFAGKGKIFCFFIGLIGTFFYVYLAYKNSFFGNMALYGLYFFPMQIIGIFKWKKHLKKNSLEIIKTKLPVFKKMAIISASLILSLILSYILKLSGGKNPYLDGFAVVFSVFGQYLTTKRCIEQWYFWFFVNLISLFMWKNAISNGAKTYATLFMWLIYLILSVYFYITWKKEIKKLNIPDKV